MNNKGPLSVGIWIVILCITTRAGYGQAADSANLVHTDTIPVSQLSEVVVKAFELRKTILSQPAPVFFLSGDALRHYSNSNVLPALNTIPGVRMEERSPSSYRLNIRGSSLRSPFGVRDVKIYYDGIPVTDPTGDTYLNQFSFPDFGNIEIIKGSVGSIYGAGIGGTMLITGPLLADKDDSMNTAGVSFNTGSFNRSGVDAFILWGGTGDRSRIAYTDLKADGYRDHTASDLQTFSAESVIKSGKKGQISFFAHYTDLYYQTPGGLTLKEYNADPRMARPAAAGFPSAATSQAAVYQKNFLSGINEKYRFNDHVENTTVAYGAYTEFINPTFRNYEYRKEPHFGGRTVFHGDWETPHLKIDLLGGMELQQGFFNVTDYGNTRGAPDTLQTDYNIDNYASTGFIEADIAWKDGWDLTAGGSLNFSSLAFTSLYPVPVTGNDRKFNQVFIPRVALSRTFGGSYAVYVNLSGGFSPPTLSELLPSTNVLNRSLQAEQGTDLDLGSRGSFFRGRLFFDVDVFLFNLTESISERTDSSGADYFVNAGGTLQHGLEAYLNYTLFRSTGSLVKKLGLWTSQDLADFSYRNYQVLAAKYSGNRLPGVAPYTWSAGLDLETRMGISAHLTCSGQERMPLNDANSAWSAGYGLVDFRAGYQHRFSHAFRLEVFAGVDNALNQIYSLGYDLNAAGGRYYNTAPGINYFGTVSVESDF